MREMLAPFDMDLRCTRAAETTGDSRRKLDAIVELRLIWRWQNEHSLRDAVRRSGQIAGQASTIRR